MVKGLFQVYPTDRCDSWTYSCFYCRAHLALHEDLISKSFQGSQGRAYLFNNVVNVRFSDIKQRVLLTGVHFVADVFCAGCESMLGWKYERAFEPSQRYKEGKVIIELAHLIKDNRWDHDWVKPHQRQESESASRLYPPSSFVHLVDSRPCAVQPNVLQIENPRSSYSSGEHGFHLPYSWDLALTATLYSPGTDSEISRPTNCSYDAPISNDPCNIDSSLCDNENSIIEVDGLSRGRISIPRSVLASMNENSTNSTVDTDDPSDTSPLIADVTIRRLAKQSPLTQLLSAASKNGWCKRKRMTRRAKSSSPSRDSLISDTATGATPTASDNDE